MDPDTINILDIVVFIAILLRVHVRALYHSVVGPKYCLIKPLKANKEEQN